MNNCKGIKLNKGKVAMVDAADYEWLNSMSWHLTDKGYATHTSLENGKTKGILMHRLIMQTPKGMYTDHIDGNKLNNRRSNLRVCTHNENCRNRKLSVNCTSNFKGVNWHKKSGKWQARVKYETKTLHFGLYENEIDAAKAYNDAAAKLFGEFALLNPIPADWEVTTRNLTKSQNLTKAGKRIDGSSSKYKGVSKTGDKWTARIKVAGKFIYLGRHVTEEAAGAVYNVAAKEAWGDMAYQNPTDIEGDLK